MKRHGIYSCAECDNFRLNLASKPDKKSQDDCGRRFFCHAPNLDTDDGDPTGPITISISYSSENLTTAHSAPGLLLSKIHIHPPTNPESRNQANQSTAELIITTQPSPILLSIPKKHQRPFATVDKQEDNEFHQFTPQVSFEKSKMRNDLLLSTPPNNSTYCDSRRYAGKHYAIKQQESLQEREEKNLLKQQQLSTYRDCMIN